MKQRYVETKDNLDRLALDVMGLEHSLPFYVTITKHEKARSNAANSRYWCELKEILDKMQANIVYISDETGYTPIEVRRMIAEKLPPEYSAILYSRTEKAAHDVIKTICGVPTSTRLGTKAFSKFEQIMETTITEAASAVEVVVSEIMMQIK